MIRVLRSVGQWGIVLLWMPPEKRRSGDIVLVDSTHFTTLFGVTESLKNFWRNVALMK